MKITRILTPLAIAAASMVAAQQAAADYLMDGDYVVRVGASWIDPDDSSNDLHFTDGLVGVGIDLDTDATWNISGAWLPVEHWGVELMYVGSADSEMDIERLRDGNLTWDTDYRLGRFRSSYSNAYLNWYPLSRDCLGQPYVGIGVNYTDFSDERFNQGINDFLIDNDYTVDGVDLGMGHSWGITGQVGVDFRFGRDSAWLVNAAVLYIDADTDFNAYFKPVNNNGVTVRSSIQDVDYDPWVFNLGVGYAF